MKNLRSYEIVDYLKQKKICSMKELMTHFHVSSATIHRDIAELVARNAIKKVHGGAAFQERTELREYHSGTAFQDRIAWNRTRKQKIAALAFGLIEEGDILFLDSSTTVSCLAELLETSSFSNLTIVTNSVTIIRNFYKFPSHYVLIGLGGGYDPQLNAFLGQAVLRELEYLNISKAFVSAFGVGDEMVTTNHEHHAGLLIKILEMAQRKYLLADSSKSGRDGLFRFASCRTFDKIITEKSNPDF